MKLITNNVPRDVLYWHDLTEAERRDFDYLDTEDRQCEASFMRYRGACYDLGEFTRVTPAIAPHAQREGWERFDGYLTESYFSAVLVRYCADHEQVVAALALS